MGTRDDFSPKTKRALALRANHLCSFEGCSQPTSGPSDETHEAVAMVGVAAHIHGAASGPGSRRYLASMTPDERKDISNGVWLCAHHANLVDRDEITFTGDELRRMKTDHEAHCAARLRQAPVAGSHALDLIAVGPDIVGVGSLRSFDDDIWTLHLQSFVSGDIHALFAFAESFERSEALDRYILLNELGDGRVLRRSPVITTDPAGGYELRCAVVPAAARMSATEIPASWALTDSHDLAAGDKSWSMVSGVDALPQHVKCCLSHQLGESPAYPRLGARFAELYKLLRGSPWSDRLFKLEAIRQAAIPYLDPIGNQERTPLLCVKRVFCIETCAAAPQDGWLPIRLELDVKGIGRWRHELSICIPPEPSSRPSWAALASPPSVPIEVVPIPISLPLSGCKLS